MAGTSLEATRRIRGPCVASFLVNQELEASLPGGKAVPWSLQSPGTEPVFLAPSDHPISSRNQSSFLKVLCLRDQGPGETRQGRKWVASSSQQEGTCKKTRFLPSKLMEDVVFSKQEQDARNEEQWLGGGGSL